MTISGILLALHCASPSLVDTSRALKNGQIDSAIVDTVSRSGERVREPLYSFWADKVPLSQSIGLFAKANDLAIDVSAAPTGALSIPVSVDFRNVPLDRALESLLGPRGLAWERKGRSARILGNSDSRLFRINYLRFKRAGSGSSQVSISTSGSGQAGRMSVNTSDELQFWDELESQLKGFLTESGKLIANRTAGTLWVKDAPSVLSEVDRFLSAVTDASSRQVELTARIYEVTLNDDHSLGIDWNRVSGSGSVDLTGFGGEVLPARGAVSSSNIPVGSSFKPATLAADFSLGGNSLALVLSALHEQGEVRSVSQPRIVTLNNQPALIKVGTDMPYFVSTITNNGTAGTTIAEEVRLITIGVVLSVTPQISSDGRIQLGIEPLITSLVGTETSRYGSTAPIVDVKQSSSMVTLRDRETVRLSGLIQESNARNERRIPLLGDIPYLGTLFRWKYQKTTNRELVIFVTPRILD
jgi:MSHA biogenesis protein MshL